MLGPGQPVSLDPLFDFPLQLLSSKLPFRLLPLKLLLELLQLAFLFLPQPAHLLELLLRLSQGAVGVLCLLLSSLLLEVALAVPLALPLRLSLLGEPGVHELVLVAAQQRDGGQGLFLLELWEFRWLLWLPLEDLWFQKLFELLDAALVCGLSYRIWLRSSLRFLSLASLYFLLGILLWVGVPLNRNLVRWCIGLFFRLHRALLQLLLLRPNVFFSRLDLSPSWHTVYLHTGCLLSSEYLLLCLLLLPLLLEPDLA